MCILCTASAFHNRPKSGFLRNPQHCNSNWIFLLFSTPQTNCKWIRNLWMEFAVFLRFPFTCMNKKASVLNYNFFLLGCHQQVQSQLLSWSATSLNTKQSQFLSLLSISIPVKQPSSISVLSINFFSFSSSSSQRFFFLPGSIKYSLI